MKQSVVRSLAFSSVCVFLIACQGTRPHSTQDLTTERFDVSAQVFEQYIVSENLTFAAEQLAEMRDAGLSDEQAALYNQQLAEAWLVRSRKALAAHDMELAALALAQAKRLLPEAPALALETLAVEPLEESITAPVEPEPKAVNQVKKAQAVPVKKSTENKTNTSSQTQKPITPSADEATTAPKAGVFEAVQTIALPMNDNLRLRRVLEDVAQLMLASRYRAEIVVQNTREFHWVAALLNTRIKRSAPDFNPQLIEVIADQPQHIQLFARKN